jgi:transketolase
MAISLTEVQTRELSEKAYEVRKLVIEMLAEAGSGHSGGALGMADVFCALYFHSVKHDPHKPNWDDRDRVVLSNGHICPVQYSTLALAGYFNTDKLKTLRQIDSQLQGHPHRGSVPGVETTSGPLGEGLSQAIGMALASKIDNKKNYIFCLTSDGEHQEGNTWEAVMFAGKNKLSNLIQIVDRNNIQISGITENIMPLEPFKEKYEAFGWFAQEIDGNNIGAIVDAIDQAKKVTDRPSVIIALTIPGKGVDFMENDYQWHGKAPTKTQAVNALAQLNNHLLHLRSKD